MLFRSLWSRQAEFEALLQGESSGKSVWANAIATATEKEKSAKAAQGQAKEMMKTETGQVQALESELHAVNTKAKEWTDTRMRKLRDLESELETEQGKLAEAQQQLGALGDSQKEEPSGSATQVDAARGKVEKAKADREACEAKLLSSNGRDRKVNDAQAALQDADSKFNSICAELGALQARQEKLQQGAVSYDGVPAGKWNEARTAEAQQLLAASGKDPVVVPDLADLRADLRTADQRLTDTCNTTEGECPTCGANISGQALCQLRELRSAAQKEALGALRDAKCRADALCLQKRDEGHAALQRKRRELEERHTTECNRQSEARTELSKAQAAEKHRCTAG